MTVRTALVTGAGRGIGAAIATALAEQGHRVALADIDLVSAERTAAAINAAAGSPTTIAVSLDVTDAGSVDAAFETVEQWGGSVEILVNNAGVISVARVEDLAETEWDRIMAVNAKGPFLCSRRAIPAMVEGNWGRIISIASDAGKTAEPLLAHYSASKFAVIGLTQSLAFELAGQGVTANAVCPAITQTSMMDYLADEFAQAQPERGDATALRSAFVGEIPLGRAIQPTDIAAVCVFLASEQAESLSGQAINVAGGHEVH